MIAYGFRAGETVKLISNGKSRVGKLKYINVATLTANVYVEDNTGGYTIEVPVDNLESIDIVEQIKKPERYNKRGTLECWDVILDQQMNFLEGSVLKYLWRYKEKNGIHDLEKAKIYIDKMIEGLKK